MPKYYEFKVAGDNKSDYRLPFMVSYFMLI